MAKFIVSMYETHHKVPNSRKFLENAQFDSAQLNRSKFNENVVLRNEIQNIWMN